MSFIITISLLVLIAVTLSSNILWIDPQWNMFGTEHIQKNIYNKKVIVTGASQGIGKEVVKEFVTMKASHVCLIARSTTKLNHLKEELQQQLGANTPRISVITGKFAVVTVTTLVLVLFLRRKSTNYVVHTLTTQFHCVIPLLLSYISTVI